MKYGSNPFTPTFGIVPPHLAGRDDILTQMADAFDGSLGNPNLSTILVGARGSGKTSLLTCIADEAAQRGWIAITVVAAPGMLDDIIQRTLEASADFIEPAQRKHATGLEIAQLLGIEWTLDAQEPANWRTRMNALFKGLETRGIGLLICVDEVNAEVDEMIRLASAYQLFIGEGRKVALVMAGLPKHTIDLIDNDTVSFLRRARQRFLTRVADRDVGKAFQASVEDAGKTIEAAALHCAVQAIGGYPYLMQLVGYNAWESAADSSCITLEHVENGIRWATDDFRAGVLESTYREMSKGDLAFVQAMLADSKGSTLTDVAQRMGKGTNYASTYKSRLLKRGVIEESPGRTFNFAIPLLREYLEER